MINPWYVVGFVDGEGCFSITVNQNEGRLPEIRLIFEIELREDDEPILCTIRAILGCGRIYRLNYDRYHWRSHVKYKVSNIRDIVSYIIPFFQRYPLQAKKRAQFEKFCLVAQLVEQKVHLSADGVNQILAIKHRDSLDALDAHVQWGAKEITLSQSPPVTS